MTTSSTPTSGSPASGAVMTGLGRPRGPQHWVEEPPRSTALPAPTPDATPPIPYTPEQPRGRRAARRGTALLLGIAVLGGAAGAGTTLAVDRDDAPPSFSTVQQQRSSPATGTTTLEAAAQRMLRSVVQVRTSAGSGSGFVIGDGNHVVTNHHVVDGSSTVGLLLPDGRRVEGRVLGSDEGSDIAVISAERLNLPPSDLGSSAGLRIGEQVIAVGSPLGLNGTVTSGIVSALDRGSSHSSQPLIQTDASINPGNSGGPLVDLQGRVVGVNSSIATLGSRGGNIGIGFAIPIDDAARIADRITRS